MYLLAMLGLGGCPGFSLKREWRPLSSCSQQASRGGGLSCGAWAPERVDFSSCGTWAHCCGSPPLEHRLKDCGEQAWSLHSMWGLPGPGIRPVSPTLADGFVTTELLGRPQISPFVKSVHILIFYYAVCFFLSTGNFFICSE